MLRKIISIKNVGRFLSSAAAGNPQLLRHVLIFGANGFGKTTLCAILRSLQSGDASGITGRKTLGGTDDPLVDILTDGGSAQFQGGAWSQNIPEITVFDGIFIAENVHSGDVVEIDQRRNLYRVIIGREGVTLAQDEERLASEGRAKQSEARAAERVVEALVPEGVRLNDFLKLPADPGIDAKIGAQEQVVAASRQASQIKARSAPKIIAAPAVPERFAAVLAKTLEGIAKGAEAQIATHIASHGMAEGGQAWLAQGVPYAATDTCPFCARPLGGLDLIAAYRAVFSEAYAALKTDVAMLRREIDQAFGDRAIGALETLTTQNRSDLEFWPRYCAFDAAAVTAPTGLAAAIRAVHKAGIALLDQKAQAPLDAIVSNQTFTEAIAAYNALGTAVKEYNAAVNAANTKIEATRAATGAADVATAEAVLSRMRAVKKRHEPKVVAACNTYQQLTAQKNKIDQDKAAVRVKLDECSAKMVKPYETRINEYLDAFNAGFRIAETKHVYSAGMVSSSYQLVINKTAVDLGDGKTPGHRPSFKNTLSSGDRSTLALAFFLTNLELDPGRAARIVVFDDPFNSQDAFRRLRTVHEIKRAGLDCAQVFVMSHDAGFLRQVWEKCPSDQRVALQIAEQGVQGCKIMPFDLEDACKGRAASEMDDLIAYIASGAGKPRDIIKKMRIVLETHCRAAYPGSFAANDWLGTILEKIQTGGEAHPADAIYSDLDLINDYSKQHHHGEDPKDGAPVDLIDEPELKGFVKLTLKIANNLQA
jgi:wobble nucleotide-excising tRNase